MRGRWGIPVLAAIGALVTVLAVLQASRPAPSAPAMRAPRPAPFGSYVAAAGTVEARTGNIAVGTPVPGIIAAVHVTPGDSVDEGDALFEVEDRGVAAQLGPAAADMEVARVAVAAARASLDLLEGIHDDRAVSIDERNRRRFALASSEAELAATRARVAALRTELDRYTIHAPRSGRILQVNGRPGESAEARALDAPLVLLGDLSELRVRVGVDEHDAWRCRAGAAAVASVRGHSELRAPLEFERIEPFMVPKTSLTGTSTERIETRVLPVLYRLDPAALAVYVGQQLDVFIEAPPEVEP